MQLKDIESVLSIREEIARIDRAIYILENAKYTSISVRNGSECESFLDHHSLNTELLKALKNLKPGFIISLNSLGVTL